MGYFRFPTISGDQIVFTSEDDLWTVSASGGRARRLTTGLGTASHARFSPDGAMVAFTANEEGDREVHVVDADGGEPRRLTWLGGTSWVVGWTPDGEVVFATAALQPHLKSLHLYVISASGGSPRPLGPGLGLGVAFGPGGEIVVCRHQEDLARWKRYRGGRTGRLWINPEGGGEFKQLVDLGGNHACPIWIGERVYFLSDHAFDGNLFSVLPTGEDLQQSTHHEGLFVRYPSSDGRRIVYVRGGDLHVLDPADGTEAKVDVQTRSTMPLTQRKFANTQRYLQEYTLHPDGHSLALTVRGKLFTMGNWEGPVTQHGVRDGSVRYRLPRYAPDGNHLIVISDAGGDEAFEVHPLHPGRSRRLKGLDIGRPLQVAVAPSGGRVAFTNHRYQLGLLRLKDKKLLWMDQATSGRIGGLSWSSDGRWLAYSRPVSHAGETSRIHIVDVESGDTTAVTSGKYTDYSPSFDPDGKYIYFLSNREFDPVYDNIYFDLNFPRGSKPYLATLRRDVRHPFRPEPRPLDKKTNRSKRPESIEIDLDDIGSRIVQFPLSESRYSQIVGLPGGRALISRTPVTGSLARKWYDPGPPKADTSLFAWDFDKHELQLLTSKMTSMTTGLNGRTMALRTGWKLRVTSTRPDKSRRDELKRTETGRASRKSGFVDLNRCRVSVDSRREWAQMFRETWRLMRDHFWNEDMSGHDWDALWDLYSPLIDKVGSRGELSDLVWAMQGSLGTSHAYEMGGDYRASRRYKIGKLGADLRWSSKGGYEITRFIRGEPGDPKRFSPLLAPGINVRVGDRIVAIDGVKTTESEPVGALLANQGDRLLSLRVVRGKGKARDVVVRPITDEQPLRYRDWVLTNRARVHEATNGRVGYVHVPNMGPTGYAEFHRDYLSESHRDGLVVDVRFNGGGHVSQLILEKLARKRLGYSVSRWGDPRAYPGHSVLGPMVCLTNEMAGSDGDIFSHSWKLLELGPLVGMRTWGGVIGIWPRHLLVDKGVSTQPEFSYWFSDVKWDVENRGTEPDIEVDIAPHDHAAGRDPQLEKGIELIAAQMDGVALPAFDQRPDLSRKA